MTTEEAISVLNFYRNQHYSEPLGTEERELAEAINEILPHYAALRAQQEHTPYELELSPIDQYDGLKRKYIVLKADTGKCVDNCFVLRPDKDAAAVAALRAYAEATDNETLATDIINWVGAEQNAPLTLDELRKMDGEPYYHVGLKADSPAAHWSILDPFIAKHPEVCGYGKSWLAYRRKPEEGK